MQCGTHPCGCPAFWSANHTCPKLHMERLDLHEKPMGDCPRCGVESPYSWSVEGLDGYIDSCNDCVQYVAQDTLDLQGS